LAEFGVQFPSTKRTYFAKTTAREIVCVKGKFSVPHNLWMKLEYQLGEYKVTNNEYAENL
jgi:hypothetical protein